MLQRVHAAPQRLRIRGFAHPIHFMKGRPTVEVRANGVRVAHQPLERVGLFVLEADLPAADTYQIEIAASPAFTVEEDDRVFTVNISMIRLVDADS